MSLEKISGVIMMPRKLPSIPKGIKNPVHAVLDHDKSSKTESVAEIEHSPSALNALPYELEGRIAALNHSIGNRSKAHSPSGRAPRGNSLGRRSNLSNGTKV